MTSASTRSLSPGSSPRVRGKHVCECDHSGTHGLIPARAGKTGRGACAAVPPPAHPRACGENRAQSTPVTSPRGSSPRVRGKRPVRGCHDSAARLIPARAGKTRCAADSAIGRTAHPRACGENTPSPGSSPPTPGSSPRVRGKPPHSSCGGAPIRLIPARAGKTPARAGGAPPHRAHPRACGENSTLLTRDVQQPGSSPRVRGKRAPGARQGRGVRLIPARAGKTRCGRGPASRRTAHPRACGENMARISSTTRRAGSSPRVRGKPGTSCTMCMIRGLIPARAGKTGLVGVHCSSMPAHPRACGENCPHSSTMTSAMGSSPRVRGKLGQAHAPGAAGRLIPARAGKTSGATATAR